jgi:hypothetical protein
MCFKFHLNYFQKRIQIKKKPIIFTKIKKTDFLKGFHINKN